MGTTILGGQAINQWTYIKTVTNANENTLSTGADLPAYDEYWIHGYIELGSGLGAFSMICNGDTGLNYNGNYVSQTAVGSYTNAAYAQVGNFTTTGKHNFDVYVIGKCAAILNGTLAGYSLEGAPTEPLSSFTWNGGNGAQLKSLLFTGLSGRTFTGRLEIYGRMFK